MERFIGQLVNASGDEVSISIDRGVVHLEVTSEAREPVEVWLTAADAALLADLLRQAAG